MNRFATMNTINAAKAQSGGMQGTSRTLAPQPPAMASANPMQNVGNNPYARPVAPTAGQAHAGEAVAAMPGMGMMGTHPNADLRYEGATDGSGVQPGARAPQVPQGAPPPGIDPNDPNNAALAGYMAR